MALLRLMHLSKLVPLAELIDRCVGCDRVRVRGAPVRGRARRGAPRAECAPTHLRTVHRTCAPSTAPVHPCTAPAPVAPARAPVAPIAPAARGAPDLKDSRSSSAVKAAKVFFYNTVVAQAYRVDVTPSRITFAFLPNQKVPKQQCEDARPWLEGIAEKVRGARRCRCTSPSSRRRPAAAEQPRAAAAPASAAARRTATTDELRQEAMADPGVQALFEIFPVEKTKIEEIVSR